jgi:alkanesulfonate monooxygenase SsuD/methylene tetrahydromethanopterin reductase-like flavin-dependent oxidoreductase (luciferase family)
MQFGAAMFFTDYSRGPGELGLALEQRGLESLWVPEHSHVPVSRATPFPSGGGLRKAYYDIMDPFVVLTAVAAVTQRHKLDTGVCLIAQRDPNPDGETGRLDRSGFRRPLPVRRR